jgi:thioredoxin-related protein
MKIMMALFCLLLSISQASHSASYEALRNTAIKDGKFLWVFIETEGCFYCQKMRKELIDSGRFQKELSRSYVFVPINDRKAQDLHLEVQFFPTSYIINPKTNSVEEHFIGYNEPSKFIKILDYIHPSPK